MQIPVQFLIINYNILGVLTYFKNGPNITYTRLIFYTLLFTSFAANFFFDVLQDVATYDRSLNISMPTNLHLRALPKYYKLRNAGSRGQAPSSTPIRGDT